MFGFLRGKDWNVVAIIFERQDLFSVSGQRVKGADAAKARDGAQGHARTIYWAVFDQQGKFLEGATGNGATNIPVDTVKKLERDLRTNRTIQEILKALETGTATKMAKPLVWMGYPKKAPLPPKDAPDE